MLALEFVLPTRVLFGPALVDGLASHLGRLGASRVLLATDRGIEKAGFGERARRAICGRGSRVELAGTFDEVPSDSELEVVERAAARSREASVDALVALGGGSVIDTAKGAALLLRHAGTLRDYEGLQKVLRKVFRDSR